MSSQRLARRYAKALLQLGSEQKNFQEFDNDLKVVLNAFEVSQEFRNLSKNPIIPRSKKKSVVKLIFENKIGVNVVNYLQGIILNEREEYLHEILKEYFVLRNESLGILKVDVQTSSNFSEEQKEKLQKLLVKLTNKKIELNFTVDETLKGGFVFRIGDTMFDTSIKRQLEILKNKFLQAELPIAAIN